MIAANKRLQIMLLGIGTLLMLPLVGMCFTNEVQWSAGDFAVAALLLLSSALLCEWVLRKVKNNKKRLLICAGVLLVLVLVWAELAVGIFGSPFAGN